MSEELLADIVSDRSASFINENNLSKAHFQWQTSCSAFSVSKGDVDRVCKYILKQPEHHKKHTFKEEYEAFIQFYQKTIMPK